MRPPQPADDNHRAGGDGRLDRRGAPSGGRSVARAGGVVVVPPVAPGAGGSERHHLIGRRSQEKPIAHTWRGEMVGRHADVRRWSTAPVAGSSPYQGAVLPDAPDQTGGDHRRTTSCPRAPIEMQRWRRRFVRDRHDPAQARQVDGGADHRTTPVDVVAAHRTQLGQLAADAPEVARVEKVARSETFRR